MIFEFLFMNRLEKQKGYQKIWRDKNKEKIKKYNAEYAKNNIDKIKKYTKYNCINKVNNKKIYRIKYYDKFCKYAEEKHLTVISDISYYKTAHSKIKVKCKQNHIISTTLNNLQRRGCSSCNFKHNELKIFI
jgi:polyribonucleotide nucleotidyltransferase